MGNKSHPLMTFLYNLKSTSNCLISYENDLNQQADPHYMSS